MLLRRMGHALAQRQGVPGTLADTWLNQPTIAALPQLLTSHGVVWGCHAMQVLHPKFRLAVPRHFMEQNFVVSDVLAHGLQIEIDAVGSEGGGPDVYQAQVDANEQADGTFQYRVLRFAHVYRKYDGFQVRMHACLAHALLPRHAMPCCSCAATCSSVREGTTGRQ